MGLSDAAVLLIVYRINNCVGQDNLCVSLMLLFYRYFIGLMTVLGRIIYGSLRCCCFTDSLQD